MAKFNNTPFNPSEVEIKEDKDTKSSFGELFKGELKAITWLFIIIFFFCFLAI